MKVEKKEYLVARRQVSRKEQSGIQRYFRETIGELRKVSWPTRQEALNLTRIVIIVMIVMSAVLGSLDLFFAKLFAFILGS